MSFNRADGSGTTAGTTNCGRPILHMAGELVTSYPHPHSSITLELPVLAGRANAGAGLMALKTRVVRTADRTTRPAADAPCLLQGAASGSPLKPRQGAGCTLTRPTADAPLRSGCGESVTYSYPAPASLRRCWEWQDAPAQTADIARIAHHEAGHAVIGEWLGLPGIRATAEPTKGLMTHSLDIPGLSEPGPDESGVLAATAASLFHAGIAAEHIWLGLPWAGPILYPRQVDFQTAEAMLKPRFGTMSSAGHGYAQRVALAVLASRWERAQGIAAHLIQRGEWRSDQ